VPEDSGTNQAGVGEPISAVWDVAAQTLVLPQQHYGVIQPTVWEHAPGQLKMLMRATQRVGYVCAASSQDYGRTWSAAALTDIPCPNSGLDAVRLADGRIVVVCNPVHEGRTPLSVLASEDNGKTWPWRLDLEAEPGEYSYPSIVQASDGKLYAVYTYRRTQIRCVSLELAEIDTSPRDVE
jgi:predicted neuraminidase